MNTLIFQNGKNRYSYQLSRVLSRFFWSNSVQIDRTLEMLMTTVGMTASDTARYGLYTPNVTVAIVGLKYTTDIDRMIELLTATVAIRAMNTGETRVYVLRM